MVDPWFDRIILMTIVANSIVLAAEDPTEKKNTLLETLDYIFLAIFSFEMVLKIIAMGFVMKPHSYLRDPWNIVSNSNHFDCSNLTFCSSISSL